MKNGDFTHIDIPADDTARAIRFYAELFGWSFTDSGFGDFQLFTTPVGEEGVGGAIGKRGESAPERMLTYVHVDSIDETVARAVELGGSLKAPKAEEPGMGSYATLLERYAAQPRERAGWHLLFIVPGRDRLVRVRRLARRPGLASLRGRTWVALLADVRTRGLSADTHPAWSTEDPVMVAGLIDDQRDRSSAAPVGSDAWLAMLATGGVEDFNRLLAGN